LDNWQTYAETVAGAQPRGEGGYLVNGVVYLIIATVSLLFGAVQPWITALYAVLMILAFGLVMWQEAPAWRPRGLTAALFGIFLAATGVQLIALPAGWLAWISPWRATILAQAAGLLDRAAPAAATVAYAVNTALARWGFVICLILFYHACVCLGRQRRTFTRMVAVALAVGVFEAVYGLLQALAPGVGVWWVPADFAYAGCATGTYICRNHFAGLMGMLWPLALGAALAQGQWQAPQMGLKALLADTRLGRQLVVYLMAGLMMLALLFSRSRGGILGMFVSMGVVAGLVRAVSGRFRAGPYIAMLLLMTLVIIYGSRMGFDEIVARFFEIDGGADGRLRIWKQVWQMVLDHPAGIGLGNFEVVEPIYVDTGRDNVWYRHAHNDYLQLVAEAGWVGAVALTAGFFMFLARGARRAMQIGFEVGRFRLLTAIGALGGLFAMAFHGFLDFNFQIPANQAFVVLLLAIVQAGLWPRERND